jgi:DNA adenine methylase
MPELRAAVRPILKWAGGKRQLLPELRPFYPRGFARYVEPFLGSGAVFLDLHNSGLLHGRRVALSDINADVVGCYQVVRDRPADVVAALRTLEARHRKGGAGHFYEVRDRMFNPARRVVHASADPAGAYTPALAAMLIYLNRTGFNGLFRVNGRGEFNVPAGRYASPLICDEPNLHAWSAALRRTGVTLRVATFDQALAHAGQDDFVYLDPPYAPVSGTARFTAYTAGGFGPVQQETLQRMVIGLASRGAAVLLSNSAAPQIKALYARHRGARTAGLRATTVAARRAINSRAASRGAVREYLITNVARRSV